MEGGRPEGGENPVGASTEKAQLKNSLVRTFLFQNCSTLHDADVFDLPRG